MGIFRPIGEKFRDKLIVLVKPHAVAIGEGIDIANHAEFMLPRHHGRGDFQHRLDGGLAEIDRRGQLGNAVHIANAIAANAVIAAEAGVRIVIAEAPAECTDNLIILIFAFKCDFLQFHSPA